MSAYYDPSTDTIHGCKEETLVYFHEEGHRAWWKKGIETEIQIYQFITIQMAIFLIGASTGNWIIALVSAIPITLLAISEIHAWIYALIKWRKNANTPKEKEVIM